MGNEQPLGGARRVLESAERVGRTGTMLSAIALVPSAGLPTVALKLLHLEDAVDLATIFVLTAPLAITAALVTEDLLEKREVPGLNAWLGYAVLLALLTFGFSLVGWFGNVDVVASYSSAVTDLIGQGMPGYIAAILAGPAVYAQIYGAQQVVTSILSGAFVVLAFRQLRTSARTETSPVAAARPVAARAPSAGGDDAGPAAPSA